MKLLICTQVMDTNHPILGFFHRWVEEFAKYCEEIHVICLEEGEYHLPKNVTVYSLGKENGRSRIKYVYRLYKYILTLRKKYDSVFVHMNEEYAILGSPVWRLLKKRIGHWRMHGHVDWRLLLSEKLVHVIFTGSKESFRLPSKKIRITGHGIDTERFNPRKVNKDIDLLTVGRITPSKNIKTLVDVLEIVRSHLNVSLTIVGKPMTESEHKHLEELNSYIAQKELSNYVHFIGAVNNSDLPATLARAKVFVHAATNGSLDKALLETLAMEVPLVTSAEGALSIPLGEWQVDSVNTFSTQIEKVLQSDTAEKSKKLRVYVENEHGLTTLIPKILSLL